MQFRKGQPQRVNQLVVIRFYIFILAKLIKFDEIDIQSLINVSLQGGMVNLVSSSCSYETHQINDLNYI